MLIDVLMTISEKGARKNERKEGKKGFEKQVRRKTNLRSNDF